MPAPEPTFLRMQCARMEDRAGIAARAAAFARSMGFDQRAGWEIGIAIQELVSNIVRHAGGGHIELRRGAGVLEVIAVDHGPGIPKPVLDAPETWSRGLGAVRRLMHELVIDTVCHGDRHSRPGPGAGSITGTRVSARRYMERRS